ncbi:1,4-alpha-glucan branching protein GlgB [Piscinibacter sp. XHJ-5]|uniref:1,4-alpha-glucan branching protein GlgB n=1 Tax=Piscinibacter sp. XHJ-5 TaxID=3037797 RepID=UPI002453608C|nr:1,4-alpha-glucan branching protein GlgB [Piscinibacter sp. XHJ-5]
MDAVVLSDQDLYLFREGTHSHLFEHLGCHPTRDGGAQFRVWAPAATGVSVIGEWNDWDPRACPLSARSDHSGIWEGAADQAQHGQIYKYRIETADGRRLDKADPFAVYAELPPATGSRVWSLEYDWQDSEWMATRGAKNALDAPIAIYEMHAGSWRRSNGQYLGWRALAPVLCAHLRETGFTHVELMPVTEHPFYGSWGYQTTSYFAPTARYGTPQDFMYFVDFLHREGFGVLLDWVPSHFPDDPHGLHEFDGTHLYEHADPRQGFHPEWHSMIFNYGRHEVRSFLVSSALFWLDKYHADGLRVDAVASMLYLDYARQPGEWIPNRQGGKENLEAIDFLRRLNESVYREHPDVMTVAEESTAWPMVSRPTTTGGLGFGMKWNMGWMHDTLAFMKEDPVHRRYHLDKLTFSLVYAFNENFVLPLSHDEVVYGKGSLLGRMPGDEWQQFANLRTLLAMMWTHPGKKLLFMGGEFGQRSEWAHEGELDWIQAQAEPHRSLQRLVGQLNALYRAEPALHEIDFSAEGFEWVENRDADTTVISFLRKPRHGAPVLVVCNLTPVPRQNYQLGVPTKGRWREVLNTDSRDYGGSGWGNLGGADTAPIRSHGRRHTLSLTLPPLSVVALKPDA